MDNLIAIVGGGPAGLISAICLARRGIKSTVFEAMDNPLNLRTYNPSRSYAIDITGHGANAIRYIDAVREFDEVMIPFNGLYKNGKLLSSWDEAGWIGSRGDIVSVLVNKVVQEYSDFIDLRFEHSVDGADVHNGTLTVSRPGEEPSVEGPFHLIIASDGGGSKLRNLAEEQEPRFKLTREDVGYYFKMLQMDQNTAALDPSYLQLISAKLFAVAGAINGPGGKTDPLWFCAVPYVEDKRYGTLANLKQTFRKISPDLLKYSSDDALQEFVNLPAQNIGRITKASQLFAGKVVFLGDAAISYPPIGQGINGAMESATVLDRCLDKHNEINAEALVQAAKDYSERWLPETQAVSWFGKKLNQAKRWHMFRALMLDALNMGAMNDTKSSTLSYSEAYRSARRLGPIWIG